MTITELKNMELSIEDINILIENNLTYKYINNNGNYDNGAKYRMAIKRAIITGNIEYGIKLSIENYHKTLGSEVRILKQAVYSFFDKLNNL